ncbi:cytochrome c biogenesis protein ResB [Nakamurella multipartita]|uniref:ResB family protein n=1 Tax=Nakamurella multipartita (strain ATCC 700099 / DSM 44233 / CIP 104796 / JCM 9543 / NBRC 105858 / Y-104) TaxID=479431 RepID=C8XAH3_NAKMY|nr:cytochrome c biogenesis protein ResB [Nakamurella multipartita]ACV77338.1 ResB family protein [Nakamurella multipartita DSM 44233]
MTHAPTRPAPAPEPAPPTRPGLIRSVLAFLRNVWRQLTSMRTALILLFLLAVASLPGALLPQWSLNTSKTAQYIADHPTIGPWLDRLGFFEVFGSPWYAAIYLLLFTSLVGCLIPRLWEFLGQLRAQPVATPRNLGRLPHHDRREVAGSVDEVADRITAGLRGWRLARRVEERPGGAAPAVTLSAEKGFVRELGNLIFHFSLLGLLVAIAVGKMVGYEGSIIVNVGSQFCSTSPASYDNFRAGLLVDGTQLSPFCLDVRSFDAEYTPAGQATSFVAEVGSQAGSQAGTDAWDPAALQVNDPLRLDGERVYLIGHGYTPHFQVSFPDGTVRDYAQPFAPTPNDPNFTSEGAVKILDPPGVTGDDVRKHQLAIVGIFAPTVFLHGGIMTSSYPAANNPGVAVDVYRGDLGMEGGRSQSVFSIDTNQVDKGALVKQARSNLMPGESITLDDGTVITFTGYNEWVSLQTSFDPAQGWALVFAVTLLIGLMISLVIKRRRVWFRLTPPPAGGDAHPVRADRTVVEVGGLARTDQAGYGEEFDGLAALADQPVVNR